MSPCICRSVNSLQCPFINPTVLLALATVISMFYDQDKSFETITPRFLIKGTHSSSLSSKLYVFLFNFFLEVRITLFDYGIVKHSLKSPCQPQCIVRPNLLGGHFDGGIIDVSVFNP